MGKNILNAREIDLFKEALASHLSSMTDDNNPIQIDKMREFKALLARFTRAEDQT